MLPPASDGLIIRGSTDSASISSGRGPDRPDRGPLEELREFAISVTLMALLRRRRMMKVATRRAMRMNIAPPMIPPSSGVVSPPLDAEDAADFGTGEAGGVTWPTTPSVGGMPVGCPGIVAVVIVVVIVSGFELPFVVVNVSVIRKVTLEVA